MSPAVLAAVVMTLSMRIKSELILQCSNINLAVFMSIPPEFYVIHVPSSPGGVLMFPLDVSTCCLVPPPVSPVPTASQVMCSCLKTPGLKLKVELRDWAEMFP